MTLPSGSSVLNGPATFTFSDGGSPCLVRSYLRGEPRQPSSLLPAVLLNLLFLYTELQSVFRVLIRMDLSVNLSAAPSARKIRKASLPMYFDAYLRLPAYLPLSGALLSFPDGGDLRRLSKPSSPCSPNLPFPLALIHSPAFSLRHVSDLTFIYIDSSPRVALLS